MYDLPMTAERTPPTLDEKVGFSANLAGAGLSDLVQMQCLSGMTSVARVSSGDDVGYLYFRECRVVHAMSPSNVGEAAALEILGWSSGSFELCTAGWPETESISGTFQSLLIRAAQARDESGRHSVIHFPGARAAATLPAASDAAQRALELRDSTPPPSTDSKRAPLSSESGVAASTRVQAAVRIDEHGNPITVKGTNASELADSVALATELSTLIGESLGLDRVVAVEATSPSLRTLIVVEKAGSIIGLRARLDVDLASVRERYGIS
jgi:hypothetical protein